MVPAKDMQSSESAGNWLARFDGLKAPYPRRFQSSASGRDWLGGYFVIGYGLGVVAGVITFVCAYIWCVANYGFLFGLGLGWLPSMILGWVVFGITFLLWGPAVLSVALCIMALAVWLLAH
jgi:hypothetical protein